MHSCLCRLGTWGGTLAAAQEWQFGAPSIASQSTVARTHIGGYSCHRCWLLVADAQETAFQDRIGSGQAGRLCDAGQVGEAVLTVAGD